MFHYSLLPPQTPCHRSPPPPLPSRGPLPLLLPAPRLLLLVRACCKRHTPRRQVLQCGLRCTQTPAVGCSKCSPPPLMELPQSLVSRLGLSARILCRKLFAECFMQLTSCIRLEQCYRKRSIRGSKRVAVQRRCAVQSSSVDAVRSRASSRGTVPLLLFSL